MTGTSIFHTLLLFLFTTASTSYCIAETLPAPKKKLHIIFDLGGVLIDTNASKAFWCLGPKNIIAHWLRSGFSGTELLRIFYQTLNTIDGTQGNQLGIRDDNGNLMPQLMCDWLLGLKKPSTVRKTILEHIDQHPEWFAHSTQQTLIKNMTRLIFDPKIFVKTRKTVSEGVELVKQCKQAGHNVYVLSNFDEKSYTLLTQQYPELFELFDGTIISGNVHKAKPDPEIFSYFTDQLPGHDCVFIDDQLENISAAKHAGMHTIWCTKIKKGIQKVPDIASVLVRLKKLEQLVNELPIFLPNEATVAQQA